TTGKLHIESFKTNGMDEQEFKSVVASIENHSSHPIAKSVTEQWGQLANTSLTNVKEVKGKGLEAIDIEGNKWQMGSERWLHINTTQDTGFDMYLYKNGAYAGALRVSDALREDAAETIAELKR